MEFEVSTIYADLDVLLDTRLATLHRMDASKIGPLLAKGYSHRITDEFEGYDIKAFHEAYLLRDNRTLELALLTEAHEFITFFAAQTLKALVSSPLRCQPKLILNTYPYVLDSELEKDILAAVAALTKHTIDIEIVFLSKQEITPLYAKEHFVMMLMYDYWNWLEIHSVNRNLVTTQLPQVQLIGPAIVKSSEAAFELRGIDTFDAIEKYTAPYIKLSLYPISKFSVDFKRAAKMPSDATG